MNARNKSLLISFLVLILFVTDRFLKFLFLKKFPSGEFFIFSDLLKFKLAQNAGVAFGLPLPWPIIISLYTIIILILFWLLIDYWKQQKTTRVLALQLVLAGAFSNLFDRLAIGKVIDYIDVKYYSVFNLADMMIVIGVIILVMINSKKNLKK